MLQETQGQALVELALVIFLFYIVITGVLQLAMLGSAQIRCQEAVRRAAWLRNTYNNGNLNHNKEEVKAILDLKADPVQTSGTRETGMAYQATYTVPAIGFLKLFSPQGFTLHAQSAVIAYNPKPLFAAANEKIAEKAQQLLEQWMKK